MTATATITSLTAARDKRGRFQPGCSGNPAGKKPGTRNRATLWREALADGEGVAIARTIIDRALKGEYQAAKFFMQQNEIKPRQRLIAYDFPEGAGAADMFEIVVAAFSQGEISAVEAMEAWRVIDRLGWVRAAATAEQAQAGEGDAADHERAAPLHSASNLQTPAPLEPAAAPTAIGGTAEAAPAATPRAPDAAPAPVPAEPVSELAALAARAPNRRLRRRAAALARALEAAPLPPAALAAATARPAFRLHLPA